MFNKTVKRTLEVVGRLHEMFVGRVSMGRWCPLEDRGNVTNMLDTINQDLILYHRVGNVVNAGDYSDRPDGGTLEIHS